MTSEERKQRTADREARYLRDYNFRESQASTQSMGLRLNNTDPGRNRNRNKASVVLKPKPALSKRFAKRHPVMLDGKPSYEFRIFERQSFGEPRLVAILEGGTFADAQLLMRSERTESGHSIKGFKKLKSKE